ncbi:MAG: ADP-ribosylation factor-like protein [Candidatus Odinarchaeota archaeon]
MELPLKPEYKEYLGPDGLKKCPASVIKGLTTFHAVKLKRLGVNTIEELAALSTTDSEVFEDNLLNRWITIAKIIMLYDQEQRMGEKRKSPVIALVGLERSGKSSLFLTLKEGQTATQPPATEFMREDTITYLKQRFQVLDFSGTEETRDRLLKEPELIPTNSILFYVIDVTRLGSAAATLKYFSRLLDGFTSSNRSPLVVFCLHKNDGLKETPAIVHIKQRIDSIVNEQKPDLKHLVVSTSIFDLKSVLESFHRALREFSPLKDIIDTELKNWNETHGFMGAVLLDVNKMILAESMERLSQNNKQIVSDELYTLDLDPVNPRDPIFQGTKGLSDRIKKKIYHLRPSASIRIAVILTSISRAPFYLAIIDTEKPDSEKINFKHLNDFFAPWIDNYFAPINPL